MKWLFLGPLLTVCLLQSNPLPTAPKFQAVWPALTILSSFWFSHFFWNCELLKRVSSLLFKCSLFIYCSPGLHSLHTNVHRLCPVFTFYVVVWSTTIQLMLCFGESQFDFSLSQDLSPLVFKQSLITIFLFLFLRQGHTLSPRLEYTGVTTTY